MKPIAVIGDSWATGPAPGSPNLGEALAAIGVPSVNFQLFTTGEVLAALDHCIAAGQTGAGYSTVFLSIGAHDIAQGISDKTIIHNLIAIGKDCAKLGLSCEVLAFPKVATNGAQAFFPDPNEDWAGYDVAARQSPDLHIVHGLVGVVLDNFPALENLAYSQFVPHYNQIAADFLAIELIGVYEYQL